MNKYQRVVVIVMAVNIALMLLFPPFLDSPLRRGIPASFEGFYPILSTYGARRIHNALLTLQVLFVVINGLIAWLLLDRGTRQGEILDFRYTRAVGLFAAANFALILLFPPFESYSSFVKFEAPSFDGFYFVAGDKRHRHFFVPLLYLEIVLITINLLLIWLLFNTVRRTDLATRDRILELARSLPPEQMAGISKALSEKYTPVAQPAEPHLGAGPDRRKRFDPRYRGPERRRHQDRRRAARVVP
jgi:hypothetical protein